MSTDNVSPRILILDIESAPKKAFVWGMWKQNIAPNQFISDWYMLTWSAKWLGEKEVYSDKLSNYDLYGLYQENDSKICESLHRLLDDADIVVAHNGDKFDIPSINTRFIDNNINPPSPYKQVDTLKIAKRNFKFTSNRLDFIGNFLGLGGKIETGGMGLWIRCLDGDLSAFEEMEEYNRRDVTLLEDVYLKLRPWDKQHPNVNVYEEVEKDRPKCPKCGSDHIHFRGSYHTNVSAFQRFQCQGCGSWGRMRQNGIEKEERKNLTLSI